MAVAAVLALGRPPAAGAAVDRLPDLGMAWLRDLSIDTTIRPGRWLLRFTTIIVNVGAGPFETIGRRPDTSTTQMAVSQRIHTSADSYRQVRTPAVMFWAGDKHGFCYFDNTAYRLGLARAPSAPVYGGCGRAGDLRVTTGISVVWGDTYPAGIAFQWIDITGLNSGRYRLRAIADPANWFAETNNANNSTWVDLRLTGSAVRVVVHGPAA